MKILLIEDSDRLRKSLSYGLGKLGFAVDSVADGREGLRYARDGQYDVVILDLMLPGMTGLEVLRELRRDGDPTHVIILSALDAASRRIEGLELGADDYLVKPFEFDELVARVRALVRRRYGAKNPVIELDGLQIDTARHEVSVAGKPLALTPMERRLITYLAVNRGRVASASQLADHIYDSGAAVTPNAIEVLISGLRKKLGAVDKRGLVATRRGAGYLIE